MSDEVVELAHPKWNRVEVAVFTRRVVADCMTHDCTIRATNEMRHDACCQYGCDVDLTERDAILARAEQIRPVLAADVQNVPWFNEASPEKDPDTPSGIVVRTAVANGGCLFLSHDRRGCAIHRAALEQQWNDRNEGPANNKVLQVSGLSYTYSRSLADQGNNTPALVGDVLVDTDGNGVADTALDPAKTYRVVLNAFLADGGDGGVGAGDARDHERVGDVQVEGRRGGRGVGGVADANRDGGRHALGGGRA